MTKDWTDDCGIQTYIWRSIGKVEDISVQFPHIIIPTTTRSTINNTTSTTIIIFEYVLGYSFYVC